ncbi:TPA_asm: Rpn family recombination-promoting nuclease/putative transposase [Salmonella enterica subsp. salamae serovar 60:g,m,t:z6]|uniref:Rpn family recombination-promoting nuclease/putative transposase n=2 Tax=Salmonella enterica TaxID=28901 RepID=A0A730ZPJ0_SALHO|nr:Rpn family recombination-promoting nuclease/putative transposase [Salmonella enterica]HAC6699996.1 Rpn family recombination-promoting nuclease/putative transposase [Salmonella bongori serovar 66:z65:-]HAE2267799.1 Rpn family recombination-promoting nuclease/putative transposase [Salmonella enterica subsp. enterica serovar 1,9,12:-:-]HAE4190238.1 Rpn family recombination-promoting nuclease/putative transposase [Salmonella enterica subsp. houtenae serovar 1,40:z4,z32:-]HAE7513788.1 Rpn family 
MESATGTPHDAVFKQFLMHVDTARDFLDIHLPAELREICDLDTLQLASGSFIEENLKAQYSDVLYSLNMQGAPGYLHILIEHQSSPDKKMAFRMIRYAIAAMHRHIEAGYEQLPLVIPILFYQGKTSPYPFSLCWLDMFASPVLAKRLYSQPFPLVDITVMPDDEIMQHRRIAVLELLQKHIRQRDLMRLLDRLVTLLRAEYTTDSQMISLLNYMLHSGHTDQPKVFYRELANRTPQGESMMTLAEWFEEQGMQKGIQQGIQKGETEAARRVAARMLKNGMSPELVAQMTDLTAEEIEQLINWR